MHQTPRDKLAAGQIRILPATAEPHLAGIAALAARIWRAYYPGIISPAQVEYMLARMYSHGTLRTEVDSQNIRFYRILTGEDPSGFASIGPAEPPGVFKLHKLYVVPEAHGHGLGWRLLRHCEAEAARLGARRLILGVNKQNAQARAFYERNGFAVTASVTNEIGGGFVMDDFIMAKDINEGRVMP